MTYLELSAWFVGAAVVAAIVLSIVSGRHRAHLGAVAVTVVVLFILTAVFDTVMIATGLFHYSADHLLGVHIGLAPLEDFAYPLAGAVLLPTLWAALRARRRARDDVRTADEDPS
ncbi:MULTISPECIES: lycopene cyclase domain-containing protein [Microbacterium]|uniref:lycopene cyclase domain-containing protein n=1 Tax=Microbacterium TaxID=33882 RepID=UPI0009A095D0|nr:MULTISPECIES: lycopene cyclase domain-containing protein [Microbacterium]AQY02289.1 lycopene e-cyclase isoprenoid transferase B [Microbacterium foliorum]